MRVFLFAATEQRDAELIEIEDVFRMLFLHQREQRQSRLCRRLTWACRRLPFESIQASSVSRMEEPSVLLRGT